MFDVIRPCAIFFFFYKVGYMCQTRCTVGIFFCTQLQITVIVPVASQSLLAFVILSSSPFYHFMLCRSSDGTHNQKKQDHGILSGRGKNIPSLSLRQVHFHFRLVGQQCSTSHNKTICCRKTVSVVRCPGVHALANLY